VKRKGGKSGTGGEERKGGGEGNAPLSEILKTPLVCRGFRREMLYTK